MLLGVNADDIQSLFDLMGVEPPKWLAVTIAALVLAGFVGAAIAGIVKGLEVARGLPLFRRNRADEKRRRARREQFAEFLANRIRDLNNKEDWTDHRFAQLEAEVEAEGRSRGLIARFTQNRKRRRAKSLTDALRKSEEQLILLQGDPGSGKSVALRHLALQMAHRAERSRRVDTVLPLYLNLKKLERGGAEVNSDLIDSFVRSSLSGINRDVDKFVEAEFDRGVTEGTWFFLFDSFDEIPEVLSATERDETVQAYSEAIHNFLHGMRECHGIVASRYFRAPTDDAWPTFHILELSEKRKAALIKRSNVDGPKQAMLIGELPAAEGDLPQLARNPMFLGLLCEYVQGEGHVPSNPHAVFDDYIDRRFQDDAERLQTTFGLSADSVRMTAEQLAFVMTARRGMGLNPTRLELLDGFAELGMTNGSDLGTAMDALEYIKLAKSEAATDLPATRDFTFAHRRFQEYFATCTVLREPDRIPPRDLLTDWSWRETSVTLLQNQTDGSGPLLDSARELLTRAAESVPEVSAEQVGSLEKGELRSGSRETFDWPPTALHVLSVLQAGFAKQPGHMPADLRELARRILVPSFLGGQIYDQKWSIEAAGVLPQAMLSGMLRAAYRSPSGWLREVAYWQVARLRDVPADLAREIRLAFLRLARQRVLWRERLAVRAQVLRLARPRDFIDSLRLALAVPVVDVVAHAVALAYVYVGLEDELLAVAVVLSALSLYGLIGGADFGRGALDPLLHVTSVMVSAFARFAAVGALALFGTGGVFPVLMVVWAIAWSPSALLAIRVGRYLRPRWWPILPLAFVLELARYLIREPRESATAALWMALAGGGVTAFFIALEVMLPEKANLWISVGIFALIVLMFIWVAGLVAYEFFTTTFPDWRRLRRWMRGKEMSHKPAEFLGALGQFRTGWGAARFVAEARAQRLLEANPENVALVRDLLRSRSYVMQGSHEGHHADDLTAGSAAPDPPNWHSEAFRRWFAADVTQRAWRLREYGAAVEDELGKLYEGLEARTPDAADAAVAAQAANAPRPHVRKHPG